MIAKYGAKRKAHIKVKDIHYSPAFMNTIVRFTDDSYILDLMLQQRVMMSTEN